MFGEILSTKSNKVMFWSSNSGRSWEYLEHNLSIVLIPSLPDQ